MELSINQVDKLLQDNNRIVITAHINPDGDSLGSCLALSRYLKLKGKHIDIFIDDDIPRLYNFLPGISEIKKPPLDVIAADLLIVLDASDLERIGNVSSVVTAPILNIDHHISNTKFADYWFIDHTAAATGEIIYQMFKFFRFVPDAEIAESLYTAIATDCGFFRYANTSANTMHYAAELIECGVQPDFISEHIETKPLGSIVSLVKVLETLKMYCNGKIASITILPELAIENTEGFINYPRIIEDVEIAIMFRWIENGTCKVSLRSKRADVSKLALEFGGGGHARAAGCTVKGTVADVQEKIVTVAIRYIEELQHG